MKWVARVVWTAIVALSMGWATAAAKAGPDAVAAVSEVVTGRVELIDAGTSRDQRQRSRSAFSFVRQVRGDGVAAADQSVPWQIAFERSALRTRWHSADNSVIAPVGTMTLDQVTEIPPFSPRMRQEVEVERGMVYVVYTRLPGLKATQLVRVAESAPGRVVLEYV